MWQGKLQNIEKPPVLYHWTTQSQALSSLYITAQVVLSVSVAHLVARLNTCEEMWPSKGVDLRWRQMSLQYFIANYNVVWSGKCIFSVAKQEMLCLYRVYWFVCWHSNLCYTIVLILRYWQTSLFHECKSTSTTLPTSFWFLHGTHHHHSNKQQQHDHQCHTP